MSALAKSGHLGAAVGRSPYSLTLLLHCLYSRFLMSLGDSFAGRSSALTILLFRASRKASVMLPTVPSSPQL